ncbi:MAG: precorrin-2 C(20)-methyltransferase [Firmicutes bacterium]|nr:precorrin-2 C(20)-methyltransferase [Bacillota bacterium]
MIGKFYGIGVGPGDKELLTIKATKILKEIDIIICPESVKGKGSIALNICSEYLKDDVEILPLTFPMTYDENVLKKKWKENSDIIYKKLKSGKDVAFLTLGDPSVYSTYMYLLPHLKEKDVLINTIPGITSFSSIANNLNIPLATSEETIGILPLRKDANKLENFLDNYDNVIIMKPSHASKKIAEVLIKKGYENNFVMVSKSGTDKEKVVTDINRLKNEKVPYLSTVIVKKNKI